MAATIVTLGMLGYGPMKGLRGAIGGGKDPDDMEGCFGVLFALLLVIGLIGLLAWVL